MPAPPDPSHSASERERRREGGEDFGGPSAGADRFWQEFSRARPERPRRGRPADPEDATAEAADDHRPGHECLEWCPICRSADVLRAAGGPEVRNQIAALQRDSLLALRTLIDAYLARSAPPPAAAWDEPPEQPRGPVVQDIPLD